MVSHIGRALVALNPNIRESGTFHCPFWEASPTACLAKTENQGNIVSIKQYQAVSNSIKSYITCTDSGSSLNVGTAFQLNIYKDCMNKIFSYF